MIAMPKVHLLEHPRVDDEKIVDRYLAGRLSPEDEARFEEHLFACADCLEQVEWGDALRRGLRAVAAEDAARTSVARGLASLGLVAWLRSRGPAQRLALAGLAVAMAVLPAAFWWQRAELSRLREAPQHIAASSGAGGLAGPMGDFQVISLGVVRGASDTVEIRPDPTKQAALLSLELPAVTAAQYRVTLLDAAGEIRWRGDDLEPNLYETLLIALPSSFLKPGSYRITIEGRTATGAEPAGEVAFRVVRDFSR